MFAHKSTRDLLAGLIFVGFGLAFGIGSLNYELGTAFRMGPGYFPLLLSALIVLLGGIILVQALTAKAAKASMEPVPWAGLGLVLGALVFFGLTVRGLGIAPALFVTTFLSAVASKHTGVLGALVIAALMVTICMLIFVIGLGLPLRMLGPWLAS